MISAYWEDLELAAFEVCKDAKTICKIAHVPASTRKNLPTVNFPQARTRKKILQTLVKLGWEKNQRSLVSAGWEGKLCH